MGSFGDAWLRCAWCRKWGKCCRGVSRLELIDVDMIGQLCMSCLAGGEAPWFYCAWCWKWGKYCHDFADAELLVDIDGEGPFCLRCTDLDEPPWQPNNRRRCARWLPLAVSKAFGGDVVAIVAKFLAANTA